MIHIVCAACGEELPLNIEVPLLSPVFKKHGHFSSICLIECSCSDYVILSRPDTPAQSAERFNKFLSDHEHHGEKRC